MKIILLENDRITALVAPHSRQVDKVELLMHKITMVFFNSFLGVLESMSLSLILESLSVTYGEITLKNSQ